MKNHYSYSIARQFTIITGIVFGSQLIMEMGGLIIRKPGFSWVIYACAGIFGISIIYSTILIFFNARHNKMLNLTVKMVTSQLNHYILGR